MLLDWLALENVLGTRLPLPGVVVKYCWLRPLCKGADRAAKEPGLQPLHVL